MNGGDEAIENEGIVKKVDGNLGLGSEIDLQSHCVDVRGAEGKNTSKEREIMEYK